MPFKYLLLILFTVCQLNAQGVGSGAPKVGDAYYFIVPDSVSRGGFVATRTFGRDPFYFAVGYLTEAEKDSIDLIPGIQAFPENIDNNIPAAQVSNIKSKLDSKDIPSHFVSTAVTWRNLLRFLAQYTQIGQRFYSQAKRKMISGNIAMNTEWQDLPQGAKDKLLNVATSFNMTKEGFTASSTVGQILKGLVDQMTQNQLNFAFGITL